MKSSCFYFFIFGLFNFYFSQTGPAGVGNSTSNAFWAKANGTLSTSVNGAPVSQWNDESGNGIHIAQSNANQQPLFSTNIINGMPAVLFDDINAANENDFMEGPDNSLLDNSTGFTLFSIVRPLGNNSSARSIFSKRTNVGVNQAYMLFLYGSNRLTLDVATNDNRFDSNPTGFAANSNYILSGSFDGSLAASQRSKIYSGQTLLKTSTESASSLIDYASPLIVGSTHVGDPRPFDGYIAELIYYRRILNVTEKMIVDNYLSSKYSIALSANDVYAGDTPANGNYDFDVAGIGQTDAADNHLQFSPAVAKGLGMTYVSGFGKGDYLMIGNKTLVNAANTTDVAVTSGGPIELRWERIWYVDVTNIGAAINSNLIFDISDGGMGNTVSVGTAVAYKLLYRAGTSGTWTIVASALSTIGDQINFNYDFNSDANDGYYNIGTLDMMNSPLPIELLSFTGEMLKQKAVLNWSTTSEINNDYFEVEHSDNGIDFNLIGKVQGQGNTTMVSNYSLLHETPSVGKNYYKLFQVNLDGTRIFKDVIVLNLNDEFGFSIYPNPVNNLLQIEGINELNVIKIYDMTGRQLLSVAATSISKSIDISNLPVGNYNVCIYNENNQLDFTTIIVKSE